MDSKRKLISERAIKDPINRKPSSKNISYGNMSKYKSHRNLQNNSSKKNLHSDRKAPAEKIRRVSSLAKNMVESEKRKSELDYFKKSSKKMNQNEDLSDGNDQNEDIITQYQPQTKPPVPKYPSYQSRNKDYHSNIKKSNSKARLQPSSSKKSLQMKRESSSKVISSNPYNSKQNDSKSKLSSQSSLLIIQNISQNVCLVTNQLVENHQMIKGFQKNKKEFLFKCYQEKVQKKTFLK
jgi:hypothetical protein